MKSLTKFLFAAIAVAAVAIAYAEDKPATTAPAAATETAQTVAIGKAAPDFTLTDANGIKHSLSTYKGKYIVLEWVNFDCPFVRKFYGSGTMQQLQDDMTKDSVVWLSICSSAPGMQGNFNGEALMNRIKQEKIHSTAYLIDEEGKVGRLYGAKTTPNMVIINPQGVVLYSGAIDNKPSTDPEDIAGATNYVRAAFASIKAGKPIEKASTDSYGCSVKYKK